MIFGSVCSGIEAASVAWNPLGWRAAFHAEIEKFPQAVLKHHYPDVPNLGDMTRFDEWGDYAIDVLVGGTPSQDFSVAGLRKGLDGERGNLMLVYAAIARRYRPPWLVWENVPGVLSDDSGRAFASLLGLLSGQKVEVPKGGWESAGIVPGIQSAYGLAWRVLDAQFVRVDGFGRAVPQRRRRVFVVGYLGDWRRAAAVLFERESLSGNPAPRRKAGKDVAPTLSARTQGGGGLGTDFDLDGGPIQSAVAGTLEAAGSRSRGSGISPASLVPDVSHPLLAKGNDSFDDSLQTYVAVIAPTLDANFGKLQGASGQDANHGHGHLIAFGGNNQSGPIDVATAQTAHGGIGRIDFESETFIATRDVAATITRGAESSGKGGYAGRRQEDDDNLVAHALRADGFDASEDGTGRGTPIIPILANGNEGANGAGIGREGDPAFTLQVGVQQAIAFDETQITSRTNRSNPQPGGPSHALTKCGLPPTVAFDCKAGANTGFAIGDIPGSLRGEGHGGGDAAVFSNWRVRRLTPRECERLQAFPDGYTLIPGAAGGWRDVDETEDIDDLREAGFKLRLRGNVWRVKDADGSRYKALGNSMACSVMRWIGQRIQMVSEIAP